MVARRFSGEDEKHLISLYQSGFTQERLATLFQTTAVTVRSTLKRAGLQIRGAGGPRRSFSEKEVAEIVKLYRQGESQEQIARQIATSQPKISQVLRARGLYSQRGAKYGQHHPRWLGGRVKVGSSGYVMVKVDNDDSLAIAMANGAFYVMEHRLVVARRLGRPLLQYETVHHINGNKSDNRIENLQLRQGRHGKGIVYTCLDCGSHNVSSAKLAEADQ